MDIVNAVASCLISIFHFDMQPSAIENGPYDYTRSGNPTRDALERCILSYILLKMEKKGAFLALMQLP